VSKNIDVDKTAGKERLAGQTVTDICFTGYRSTGIKTAGALHRLLFGTGEASQTMRYKCCNESFLRENTNLAKANVGYIVA
jgi:hypothetical protein